MPLPFAEHIWLIEGSLIDVAGFQYPTRAAVIKLETGELVIWSPVALDAVLKNEIDQIGPVRYLIAPNTFHHVFLRDWQSAYPAAQLFGPSALRKKRLDLSFHGDLDGGTALPWQAELPHVMVANKLTPESVFFHRVSQTVLFTDLIQQFPVGWHKGWRGIIARLDLMVGDAPNVPRKFRLGFGPKEKARAMVKPILDWPCERIIMAHGTPVTNDGAATLRRTFDWLF